MKGDMIREIKNNQAVCETCHAPFPRSWVGTKDAVQKGTHFYCSAKCYQNRPPKMDFPTIEEFLGYRQTPRPTP